MVIFSVYRGRRDSGERVGGGGDIEIEKSG